MTLESVEKDWEKFAKTDPLWSIITFKDKRGNRWQIDDFFATGEKHLNQILEFVEKSHASFKFGKALDFGCGVGRVTQALAARFTEVNGVDISPTMIELTRKYNRYGEKCVYWVNALDNLRIFADDSFDFVHSVIVLQHMKPLYAKRYLLEFLRVTSPSGLIVFQLPSEMLNSRKPKIWFRERFLYLKSKFKHTPRMAMYGIKQKQLISFLEANGAEIINIQQDRASLEWKSYTYLVRKRKVTN